MDELLRILVDSLPEMFGGLAVAGILAIIGAAYARWKRRSIAKPAIVSRHRQAIATYLQRERAEILSAFSPGSTTLLVGDIVGDDKLFIPLPWANYLGAVRSDELVDYLIGALSRGERVLLLGEPGQGKTTVLKRVFTIMVDRFLAGSGQLVCVFIPLREVTLRAEEDGATLSWLGEYLCNKSWNPFPTSPEQFVSLAREGRVVFLLDGFDEMTGELSQRRINERAASDMFLHPGILSCRTNFYELYLSESVIQKRYLDKAELLPVPFGDPLKRYIAQFCEVKGDTSSGEIISTILASQELQDLAQRPLLLNMILDVFTESRDMLEIEWSLAKLYEAYTEKWLKNEATKPDSVLRWDEKAELVEEIAWSTYRAKDPSTYAYGDRRHQTVVFFRDELSGFLQQSAIRYLHIPFARLVDDICFRTFLIGSYGNHYYFIHKSFQEYYVAGRVFRNMQRSVDQVAESLREFIPVEVSVFLTDMLTAKDLAEYDKRLITSILNETYQQYKGNDKESLLIRQHAAHYLARLGTQTAAQFLEQACEREPDKWVWRGIMVGLFRFCGKTERLDQYIDVLHDDPESASINVGYHLVYYGDQPLEEGYYDRGGKKCDGTLRAIFRHLRGEEHKPAWALDLLTLRSLLETRGVMILEADSEYLPFLRAFLNDIHEGQSETLHREKEILRGTLRKVH